MNISNEERTIGQVLEKIENIDRKIDTFVTQDQFWPVKTLVYGFVGLILVAVTTTIIYGVILTNTPRTTKASVTNVQSN